MRAKNLIVPVCVALTVVATSGWALLVPKKAKQIKGEFVVAYTPCAAADATTYVGPGYTACPAYPPTACQLGPDGSGKYQIKAVSSGGQSMLKVQAKLTGLINCENEPLYWMPILRLSSDSCGGAPDCTALDFNAPPYYTFLPLAYCTVADGRCDMKTTVPLGPYAYNLEIGDNCLIDANDGQRVACGGMRLGSPLSPGEHPTPAPTATPTPTATATPNQKRVFVTSLTYQGNLGGLGGADTKCQARATAASLPGTYKAWLSTGATSAASRLTQSMLDYVLVDGTVVANGWSDLTDGTLDTPIILNESGVLVNDEVWTNCTTTGAIGTAECAGWTSVNPGHAGQPGSSIATDATWTFKYNYAPCDQFRRLYCIQQ